jgi:hypothetical protein
VSRDDLVSKINKTFVSPASSVIQQNYLNIVEKSKIENIEKRKQITKIHSRSLTPISCTLHIALPLARWPEQLL